MGVEAILAIAGLLLPPVVDFVKKKFLKGQDTPEATLSTLATTKPEVMPQYIESQAKLLIAQKEYFNRDICGIPSQWIVDLRASIRPIGVVFAFIVLCIFGLIALLKVDLQLSDEAQMVIASIRYSSIVILTSWFGDRISTAGK